MKILTIFNSTPDNHLDVIYRGLKDNNVDIVDLKYTPTHNGFTEGEKATLLASDGSVAAVTGRDGMMHFEGRYEGQKKCHVWMCTTDSEYVHDPDAIDNIDDFDAVLTRSPMSQSLKLIS